MTPPASASLAAVFVGGPKTLTDEAGSWCSSIQREPVSGAVELTTAGIVGDKVTQPYHGSPDAALCVHLSDHYSFWDAQYGVSLPFGTVGENITLSGITEDQVFAGDVVRLGSAIAQVSGPRVPCANQARYIGRQNWVKLTVRENRTGFYMRVLHPGTLQAGDPWQLEERWNEDAAIPAINRCMYLNFDPDYAQRMLEMRALGAWWKQQAAQKLAARDQHWTSSLRGA